MRCLKAATGAGFFFFLNNVTAIATTAAQQNSFISFFLLLDSTCLVELKQSAFLHGPDLKSHQGKKLDLCHMAARCKKQIKALCFLSFFFTACFLFLPILKESVVAVV